MVGRGCAERRPHPVDARARPVVPAEPGRACTRAAEEAATEAVRGWSTVPGEGELRLLWERLARIAPDGPVRPGR
ncbi:hypothetical protein HCJ93_21300 [Streptomyces sp. SBST2-5]|uniref:Aldehyde dehydrogenase family protein n=1 Tax=Streptomyces composti TaxID=2720025 RepID=A0ABX1ACZ6_9ACTN|nr:hypothetical protein [Streptomyces composti]